MAAARLAVLRALWSPRNIIPNQTVRDIRNIDFKALRNAGFEGVVFDKDNCLTLPLKDDPIPSLLPTLHTVQSLFPRGHVLIVSNSAGSYTDDPDWLEAEGVERAFTPKDSTKGPNNHPSTLELRIDPLPLVHILRHRWKKPSRKCAKEIWAYFERVRGASPIVSSLSTVDTTAVPTPSTLPASPLPIVEASPPPASTHLSSTRSIPAPGISPSKFEASAKMASDSAPSLLSRPRLVFVGDRLMTDVLLANEMGAYSIWTTHLWKRDVMVLRAIETGYLGLVKGCLWLWARDWRRLGKSTWSVVLSLSRAVGSGVTWALNSRSTGAQQAKKAASQEVTAALSGLQAGPTLSTEPHPKRLKAGPSDLDVVRRSEPEGHKSK